MSVEMACGSCQGRFVVAAAGTVACPHCGAHLAVSADTFTSSDATIALPEVTANSPATEDAVEQTFSGYADLAEGAQSEDDQAEQSDESAPAAETVADTDNSAEQRDAEPIESPTVSSGSDDAADSDTDQSSELPDAMPVFGELSGTIDENAATADLSEFNFGDDVSQDAEIPTELPSFDLEAGEATVAFTEFEQQADDAPAAMFAEGDSPFDNADSQREASAAFPDFGAANDQDDNVDAVLADAANAATIVEERPTAVVEQAGQETDDSVAEATSAPPATMAAASTEEGVSRTKFFLLASYASAVTIVCLWLIYEFMAGGHPLDLRDPAEPLPPGAKKSVQLFQIDATMPRGHLLQLGDSQRFGNILVEPLKVTRGLLDFAPYSTEIGTNTFPPDASDIGPTLKLWLRFTNVSEDQTIAPLDTVLLYDNRYRSQDDYNLVLGNTFVCRTADKKKNGHLVYCYSLNLNKSWDLRGQNLKELAPGESVETYIAAGPDGIDKLKGDLIWRVHFRKGYSPSGKGVTTLFEVDFQSGDIQAESSAPAKQATAAL